MTSEFEPIKPLEDRAIPWNPPRFRRTPELPVYGREPYFRDPYFPNPYA